ncbi:MAG: lipopolysaccharide biosynthesis protein [Planctomycetota bacterium]|nr:lipopolysaccharide biosynthesis protein [Planctomycetota bacterium]
MAIRQSSLLRSTLTNWLGLITALAVTLIFAPLCLTYLGPERFGVYGIARQAIGFLMILDLGILGAVNRLTARHVALGDKEGINRVVSVSFFLYGGLSLVALALGVGAALLGPGFFHVSPEFANQTLCLFALLGLNLAVTLIGYPWTGLLYSHNRYDLVNSGIVGSRVLSMALVIVAFQCGLTSLGAVGLAMTIPTVLQWFYVRLMARRQCPSLTIAGHYATRDGVREVVGFSLWNLLYNVGAMVILSSDNILIGRLLGPDRVPYYYLPFQLITVGHILVVGMSSALTPMAAGMAAGGGGKELRPTLVRTTRIALVIALCANGVMIVMAKSFLPLWVREPGYEGSWVIYAVLMGGFWAFFAAMPAYNMLLGAGDIRGPAIGIALCGAAAVAVKIVLAKGLGLGLVAIAWGTTGPLLLFSGLYMPWAASRMVGMPLGRLYVEAYLGPIACLIPVLGGGAVLVHFFPPANLLVWALWFALLAGAYVGLCWPILDAADRARILGLIQRGQPMGESDGPTSAP